MARLLCAVSAVLLVVVQAAFWSTAHAGSAGKKPDGSEVETTHIFGFTTGSDVGSRGNLEAEIETEGGVGKRAGAYAAFTNTFELKYTPFDNFRIGPKLSFAYHDIAGMPGLDDRRQFAFQGLAFNMKYRLLDREKAPVGLTLVVDPHWNRIDDGSGERVDQYGSSFGVLLDRELVAGRLYGAVNAIYEPVSTRLRATGEWERESTIGLGIALANQIRPGIFLGAETRYQRKYDSLGLSAFASHALFVGPTVYIKLSRTWWMGAAWNVQVAGGAVGASGALDLANFTRHQVMFRFGVDL